MEPRWWCRMLRCTIWKDGRCPLGLFQGRRQMSTCVSRCLNPTGPVIVMPTIGGMVISKTRKNLAGRILHTVVALTKTSLGLQLASQEQQAKRRVICESCSHRTPCLKGKSHCCGPMLKSLLKNKSSTCGCVINRKVMLKTEACPLGKWGQV